jgi:5-formyltetrahydrofolate cyclo-ligase
MRARRRGLDDACRDAGERAAALLPLRALPLRRIVAGYVRHGSEIDPAPVLARLEAAGARIALPVCTAVDAPLAFRAWTPEAQRRPDATGVLSPPASAELLTPDLLIVPLVAFDRTGGRLGQGGGHFDRTLEALDARGPVFALGLAFSGQEAALVPMEEHDRRLDAILTEREYIAASALGA